jgi:drug/metabolite transporter (DMT)-like permease
MTSLPDQTFFDRRATIGGMLAVFFWSFAAPTIAVAEGVSPFLFVSIEHTIALLVFSLRWAWQRHNPLPELRRVPLWFYGAAVIGITGHQLAWVAAMQQAPPLEATLIIYTWPLLIVIFTAISLKQKLRGAHIAGGFLGLLGMAALMMGRGMDLYGFHLMPGHVYAVFCALSWSIFAALAARQKSIRSSYLTVIFALGVVFNSAIWYFCLGAPMPPTSSLLIVAGTSVFISLGYPLYDFAIKKGNTRIVAIFSFFTPVLATFYLVMLGKASMTIYLLVALLLVVAGIAVAKYGDKKYLIPAVDFETTKG